MATTKTPNSKVITFADTSGEPPEPKKLSPLFKPTDFYYYNAQFPTYHDPKYFPYGTNFLLSILGIDLSEDDIRKNPTVNPNNPNINASFISYDPGQTDIIIDEHGAYSIPFRLVKEMCSSEDNKKILYNNIRSALKYQFDNEPQISDLSGNTKDGRTIQYDLPKSLYIKDVNSNTHEYFPISIPTQTPNSKVSNSISFNQNSSSNNLYGDANLNVVSKYDNYKHITKSNGSNYYVSTNSGNKCYYNEDGDDTKESYSKNKTFKSTYFKIKNNDCSCDISDITNQSYCYSFTGKNLPVYALQKDKYIDLFVNNLTYMSFDVYPDYSAINVFNNPKNTAVPNAQLYDPNVDLLTKSIYDYCISLCENQEKAEAYQYLVNQTTNSGAEDLYKTAVDKYYREYQRILNISVGIAISIGIIYGLSK